MKIACIGGGPGGLYFSILMKSAFPETEIAVYERNRPDDTFFQCSIHYVCSLPGKMGEV